MNKNKTGHISYMFTLDTILQLVYTISLHREFRFNSAKMMKFRQENCFMYFQDKVFKATKNRKKLNLGTNFKKSKMSLC